MLHDNSLTDETIERWFPERAWSENKSWPKHVWFLDEVALFFLNPMRYLWKVCLSFLATSAMILFSEF